jgi:F-type H+-transporting ATPase subunit b
MSFVTLLAAEGKEIDPARSIHWLWPAQAELIWGTLASIVIFSLLYKLAGPPVKKAMAARTERIRDEIEGSELARTDAVADAASIRQAAGDIEAERQRLLAEADAQAEAVLAEGRVRLEQEVSELMARAEADIATGASRINDELRVEISRLASTATDRVLADGIIDDSLQQALIEDFIARVGASS